MKRENIVVSKAVNSTSLSFTTLFIWIDCLRTAEKVARDKSYLYMKLLVRKNIFFTRKVFLLVALACWAVQASAEGTLAENTKASYSPYANQSFPTNLYWGDTHVHTNLSMDAYLSGNRQLGPSDAYRFARGEPVAMHNGMNAKLDRPLDFLVVADHAFVMGGLQFAWVITPLLNPARGHECSVG